MFALHLKRGFDLRSVCRSASASPNVKGAASLCRTTDRAICCVACTPAFGHVPVEGRAVRDRAEFLPQKMSVLRPTGVCGLSRCGVLREWTYAQNASRNRGLEWKSLQEFVMTLEIVWRNPETLIKSEQTVQRIRDDESGAVYVVTHPERTQEFSLISSQVA